MASILTPPPKAESDYGINFYAIEKFFSETIYFSRFHDLPLEGNFKKIFGSTHKTGLLIPYFVKGFDIFLPEDLIFPLSRDLPLEGENFPSAAPIKSTFPTHPLVRGYIEKLRSQENFSPSLNFSAFP